MTLLLVGFTIFLLIILIAVFKLNTFLAFLIASIFGAILLGIPAENIPMTIEKGLAGILGPLVIIIVLGAMFGKLISDSGAAQRIASILMKTFGKKYMQWALLFTGFIVGIPLFYNVGFVLLVPLIFSVAFQYKLPVVFIGLPLLAALSVTHGYLPPHPSPTAIIPLLGADIGQTLILGFIVAIPSMIIAGPVFSKTLINIQANPLETFRPKQLPEEKIPGTFNSFFTALFPVGIIALSTLTPLISEEYIQLKSTFIFLTHPSIVMLLALIYASFSLGIIQGLKIRQIMTSYSEAVKDIALILLIIAGAGVLKQVLTESGTNNDIALMLQKINLHPLLLAWLIALLIRVCVGSATIAGLTAAGIVAPLCASSGANPNLMVLAIGAGSLMLSHVNDSGFWLFKEYFKLSLKDTLRSWTLMETIVGTVGIIIVLILDLFI